MAFKSHILIIAQRTSCRFRHFSLTMFPDLHEELIKTFFFFSVVARLTVLSICSLTRGVNCKRRASADPSN